MSRNSSIFDGFELIEPDTTRTKYFFTVQRNTLCFSVGCIDFLGEAEYVRVLKNERTNELAIMAAGKTDEHATKFFRKWGKKGSSQRVAKICNQDIRRWVIGAAQKGETDHFSIEGRAIEEEGAIIFDLSNPTKPTKSRMKPSERA